VREIAALGLSNTADPGNASQVNGGPVQATAATSTQAAYVPQIHDHSAGGHFAE
jgi:hypothetical protein